MSWDMAARNLILDSFYGANHHSSAPSQWYLALFNGDPMGAGIEPTSAGNYARLAIASNGTNFPAASSAQKSNLVELQFPTSTDAWSQPTVTHWAFYDNNTGGVRYQAGQIQDGGGVPTTVTVNAASITPVFAVGSLILRQGS